MKKILRIKDKSNLRLNCLCWSVWTQAAIFKPANINANLHKAIHTTLMHFPPANWKIHKIGINSLVSIKKKQQAVVKTPVNNNNSTNVTLERREKHNNSTTLWNLSFSRKQKQFYETTKYSSHSIHTYINASTVYSPCIYLNKRARYQPLNSSAHTRNSQEKKARVCMCALCAITRLFHK